MIKNYTFKNNNSPYFTKTTGTVNTSIFTPVENKRNPISWIFSLLLIFTLMLSSNIYAQFPGNDNTPGVGKTFNVPAGVTSVTASAWGGGGGGGGSSTNGSGGNGGGGGGAITKVIGVAAGNSFTYTVGSAGTAGAAAAGTGGNGTLSSITSALPATNLTANPGTGGLGNAAVLNAPTNSGGGTAVGVGGTTSTGINGVLGGASGGNGGNSGTVVTIFGAGATGFANSVGNSGGIPGGGGAGGERNGGTSQAGGAGGVGQVSFTYISVTAINPSPICIGNQITITGTNFAVGVSTVTIGGIACTSVTRVNATTITAIVGAGTPTGAQIVTIVNPNGTNNGITITINAALSANAGGAATVCTGLTTPAFTNASGGGSWSIIAGTGTASINAGGVVTGLTAGSVTVVYTLGNCTATSALTVNATPAAIGGGAATVCTGLTTPAFTDATGGGTWSITPGTGTASITAGGVVTGLTAGNVTVVYTVGTCSISTALTVNSTPASIAGGAASVCTGANTPAFTDATGGGTWSITPGTGTASITAGGVVTGTTGGTVTVVYTVGTCSVTTPLTVNAPPAITTNPSNASIAIGANASFTTVASNTPISYTWQVSTNGGGTWTTVTNGGVYSNATTATLNITAAPMTMNGYQYQVSATNACGTSAYSTAATLIVSAVYCPSVPRNVAFNDGITRVQFNTINNITSANAGNEYTDYTAQNTSVIRGGTYPINVYVNTDGAFTQAQMAWIDWNQNGDFTDAGEAYQLGTVTNNANGLSNLCPLAIDVPLTALLGTTRMRVSSKYNSYAGPCDTNYDGEVEDYSVTIITGPACATPVAQPTALILTPGGTFVNGSFTAAAGADHYLVVINTTNVAPTPSNGTTYAIGDTTLGGTNVIVDIDSNTTFTAGQLNLSTTYYVFVFSYNNACTGGPLYRTVTPLNGPVTTTGTPPGYCTPVTTSVAINRLYVSSVAFVGTLNDTSNVSTTDGVADGYQDFTGLPKSIQAQAGPINMKLTSDTGRGFWKVWVDWNKDGDFTDSGEEVYNPGGYLFSSTTFGFIVPANAAPGNYRMRIRVQNTLRNSDGLETSVAFDSCNSFDPIVIGGVNYRTYGEAEDYLFTVIAKCDNKITSITNPAICGAGTATLSAVGTGTNVYWYDALTGGSLVGNTVNGANFTPVIAATTTYYITSWSAACETLTRIPVIAEVKPVPGLVIATPNVTICGENNIIKLDATGNNETAYLINEDFEGGALGVFSNVNSDATTAAQKGQTAWKNKTSIFVANGNRWFPAISSGFGTNKFVLTSMDDFRTVPLPSVPMQNSLTLTTAVNPAATAFTNLTLSLRMYYSRYFDDGASTALENCNIEISTNGGATWPISLAAITADQGYGSNFVTLTYNLNAYIASNNLKIRIRVLGDGSGTGTAGDGAAIDDVKLYGDRPLTPFFALGGGVNAFTDAAATIPYIGDQRNTIWINPTLTQLEQASFIINVSANLNNGCTTNGTINVTNQTKIWKGTTDNDWNKPSNWLPAVVPDATTCVIIPTGSISKIMNAPDALAKNLTVKAPTGNLELQSGRNLTVTDWINVEAGATFNVRNSANLVQVTNAPVPANSGNINMERITNLRLQDYSYWSSPVGNAAAGTFAVTSVSPATPSGYIFKWGTTTANPNGGQGYWINTSENMVPTIGYIVRAPNGFNNATTTPLTANFIGAPNNGIFTTTINRGTDFTTVGTQGIPRTATDDNWNLLGNPYPSSMGVNEFLTANAAKLSGGIRLWTHGQLPTNATDPFYENFASNYYATDYIAVNLTGATSGAGDVKIGAGQGFMVLMNAGAPGSNTVTFNNNMRSAAFGNNVFYKNEASTNETATVEKHRIWLDLVGATGNATRTLVGYVAGATQANDDLYDSFTDYKNSENFYSLINTEIMQIQGRALPFENTDFVPMGFKTSVSGSHSIAIADVDGIFSDASQNILLEDKLLNTTHNLKESPYTFTTAAGIFNDRFVLRYSTTTALSIPDFDVNNTVKVFTNNNIINVTSTSKIIKDVIVYDVLGKTIVNKTNINKQEVSLNELKQTSVMLIVKVTLENNEVVVKKVIF